MYTSRDLKTDSTEERIVVDISKIDHNSQGNLCEPFTFLLKVLTSVIICSILLPLQLKMYFIVGLVLNLRVLLGWDINIFSIGIALQLVTVGIAN